MPTLADAKRKLLDGLADQPWCLGIGVGLVGPAREKGLVVSIDESAPVSARETVASLAGDVPVQIRVLGKVRKRV